MTLLSPTPIATRSPRVRLIRQIGLITIAVLVIGVAIAAVTFSQKSPHAKAASTWTQVWGDEFSGGAGSGLNTSNWQYDTGQGKWGTGEIENMTSSTNNVYQDGNGHLVVKAIRDGNGNWTSGRFESAPGFTPPAGGMMAFESSISLPNVTGAAAQGYWPAFWALGNNLRSGTPWPTSGEIDTMESINGTNTDYAHFHCGTATGGPCNEPNGIGGGTSPSNGGALQGNFHTYRMELDMSTNPQQIRFYLDGRNFYTLYSNQVDATTWSNATSAGFFIMYDLAIGGGWPGNPTSSTVSGASMVVDYVHVYYASSGSSPPSSSTPIGKTIWLKAYTGNYVSARIDQANSPLEAMVGAVQAWEEFDVIDAGNGTIALKAHANSNYVSARTDQTNSPLQAVAPQVQGWEQFRWLPQSNGTIALQSAANNNYVSARTDQTNSPLDANVAQIQAWEQFTWGTV
jgi:beta-glucanase (GH16 family)